MKSLLKGYSALTYATERLFFVLIGFVIGAGFGAIYIHDHPETQPASVTTDGPQADSANAPANASADTVPVPAPEPAPNVPPVAPPKPIDVTATDLYQAFDANEVAATQRYGNGALLRVSGTVVSVDLAFGKPVVTLDSEISENARLYFDGSSHWIALLHKSDRVSATCTYDNFLMASVLLNCQEGHTVSHADDAPGDAPASD